MTYQIFEWTAVLWRLDTHDIVFKFGEENRRQKEHYFRTSASMI